MLLTKKSLRENFTYQILKLVEKGRIPWQKPWKGIGKNVGFARNAITGKKFFGLNVILLQIAAKRNDLVSKWWATAEEWRKLGSVVQRRPASVPPGDWGTEIVFYKPGISSNVSMDSVVVYNADQLEIQPDKYRADPGLMPNYAVAQNVLFTTDAVIKHNKIGIAQYCYPPYDYITLPGKKSFEDGLGGLTAYYESLAHELLHWTECRLGFDTDSDEAIRELRADIGASMLMEELSLPHSISTHNFMKWQEEWIDLLRANKHLIFQICASASHAVDYVLKFSNLAEPRHNEVINP